jgi:hypothetical protein
VPLVKMKTSSKPAAVATVTQSVSEIEAVRYRVALLRRFRFLSGSRGGVHTLPAGWLTRFREFCYRYHECTWYLSGDVSPVLNLVAYRDGAFVVSCGNQTAAVERLLSRYQRLFQRTCCRCGGAGKHYTEGGIQEVLCPRCAAPYLLLADLHSLAQLRSSKDFAASPMVTGRQIPAALRQSFLTWAENRPAAKSPGGEILGCYPWDALTWISSLAPLQKDVEEAIKRAKNLV